MKVEALKDIDVRGIVKYYVKFNTDDKEYIMNVGDKTYQTVKEMQEGKRVSTEDGKEAAAELNKGIKALK